MALKKAKKVNRPKNRIDLYDTTLRDGTQAEKISFTLKDSIRIAHRLDEFGVDYIEGGWPGAIPKDREFFEKMKKEKLKNSKLTAFGATAHPKNAANKDPNLIALIESGAPVLTIFGKSWDFHLKVAYRVGMDEYLKQIEASVKFLKKAGREVIYDAEHFFDGYAENPEYALRSILAAQEGGADTIVLCETNGGRLPFDITSTMEKIRDKVHVPLGIHAHNDAGTGVANALAGVLAGCVHVQGTMNGIGERCGNANLCSIIPALELKMDYKTGVGKKGLKMLTELSHYVCEMANIRPDHRQPYVGTSAFAHKGGIHVSAVRRNPKLYEHVEPETVGTARRILISEQAGAANIFSKASELGYNLDSSNPAVKAVLGRIKELEVAGFEFEAADGSFEMLLQKSLGDYKPFFEVISVRTTNDMSESGDTRCEAAAQVRVDGKEEHSAAVGNGPVNALANAIYKALIPFYPELKDIRLTDYKVRVLDAKGGTGAAVRVLIEFTDKKRSWTVVGVSENVIVASWQALVDGIEFKLYQSRRKRGKSAKKKPAKRKTAAKTTRKKK